MADVLRIRKWKDYQNYRADRGQPPWIKVHRSLMRKAKWVSLTDAQRGQLVSIWMLAADKCGVIPSDPELVRKLCYMDATPDIQLFIRLGFIEPDANPTPTRRQDVTPETETETETETKAETEADAARAREDGLERFPAAAAALDSMTHPGGRQSTDSTLRARFLYTDDGLMADPSVVGLERDERVRLVALALVEMRDQGEHWSTRRLAGFIRRLKNQPPGSEASQHTAQSEQERIEAERWKSRRSAFEAYERDEQDRIAKGGPTRLHVELPPEGVA